MDGVSYVDCVLHLHHSSLVCLKRNMLLLHWSITPATQSTHQASPPSLAKLCIQNPVSTTAKSAQITKMFQKTTWISPVLFCANSLLLYCYFECSCFKRKWHSNFPSNQIISSITFHWRYSACILELVFWGDIRHSCMSGKYVCLVWVFFLQMGVCEI